MLPSLPRRAWLAAIPIAILALAFDSPVAAQASRPAATAEGYAIIKGEKADIPVIPMGDPQVIARLLDEGKNRNQVMDHLTHMCTTIGPRLTGSTQADQANNWALEKFRSWGYDAHLWEWGTIPVRFDRGPSSAKVGIIRQRDGEQEFQSHRDLEFTTLAWAAGTDGPVRGRIIKMPANEQELEAAKDQIEGSWILVKAVNPGDRRGITNNMSARQTAFAEIRKRWAGEIQEPKPEPAPEPAAAIPADGISGQWVGTAKGGPLPQDVPFTLTLKLEESNALSGTFGYPGYQTGPIKEGHYNPDARQFTFAWEGPGGTSRYEFIIEDNAIKGESPRGENKILLNGKRPDPKAAAAAREPTISMEEQVLALKPAGWISASADERVRTSSIRGWRDLSPDKLPQDVEVQVRRSDYDYINSRLADGSEIWGEFDLPHTFTPGPIPVHNVVAEIKGSLWPDEVVIVSAHIDSWNGPGSQGTTDNGTGTCVTLEAARLIAAAKAKPKRTMRFILWTGEEQGLLGSREYVKHLKESGQLEKISAVFVDDGGTNYEGGLHCAEEMVPYLAAATAPVNGQFYSEIDGKHLDVNIQPTGDMMRSVSGGSSDHASFNREGVPGFFWQEVGRADYFHGWHTQHDKIDLAIPEYLIQSSTCAAITAYNLACAPALLPRPAKSEEPEQPQGERPRRNREGSQQPQ